MDTLNKRTHIQGLFVLFALIFLLGFSACDDTDDCATTSRNEIILKAVTFNTRGVKIDTKRSFDLIFPIGTTDTLYIRKDTIQYFNLPVNFNEDTTAYYLRKLNRVDTLVFSYKREQRYLSPYCGLEVIISNVELKYSSMVDSLSIVKNRLSKSDSYNVEIFN